ncbi:chemotaxis protein CheW [Noviherbaspirillum galbum]|uniref:Chemotaxis protein CheW n=1 Tax=Noviherbaspirillum galbum TaxID=2709383 RepID=A0A6B3SX59_9BURK|nr:chemotaxis protein CheW [Noviherbaspirillum galbum]NEX62319.1 chemotaxis protein CheW [Noviherbaspirillum galbum]
MNHVTRPSHTAMSATHGDLADKLGKKQFLTFMLSGEMHAISILNIKEIIEYGTLTTVPMMPDYVRGIINLRGAVVPVVDLAIRFGRSANEVTKRTCIVIMEVRGASGGQTVGLVVDSVNAVVDIPNSDIEPAPLFGAGIRRDFIEGMGKLNGKFVILVNVDHVLAEEELDRFTPADAALVPLS